MWYAGHVGCLAFVLDHVPDHKDYLIRIAVHNGYLECVKLLVAKGYPIKPYRPPLLGRMDGHGNFFGYLGPEQMRCLQYMFGKGCSIDAGVVIWAAKCGDVELMRTFHKQGAPFWDCTWEENIDDIPPSKKAGSFMRDRLWHCNEMNILAIPRSPQHANHMWKALFYGSVMGAPLTPGMAEVFKAKRRSTQALLLSIHVATRLSQGEGTETQKAAWAALARMPLDVTGEILVRADLEIPGSLRRNLFGQQGAKIQGRIARVHWSQLEGGEFGNVWEYTPVPSGVERAGLA